MTLFQKYILPYFKQYKGLMTASIFLGTLTFLASSALTFTAGYLITRSSEMPYNILMVYVPIVLVRAFGIARPVSHYFERLTSHNTVLTVLGTMRVKLYDALETQALFVRSRFQAGDILGTLADDIEHLLDAYVRTIFPVVIALFLFLFSVVVLAVFDWIFALWIALCLVFIIFVYPYLSLYLLKKRRVQVKEKKGSMYRMLTDTVFGITDWIISGKKERFQKEFTQVRDHSLQIEKKMTDWTYSRSFQLQMLTGLILIFVGIWAGLQAQEGNILPTYIASFTLVTLPLLEGLLPTSEAIDHVPKYQESLQRIDQIQKFVPEEKNPQTKFSIPRNPDIQLTNVTFRYEGSEKPALENFSLDIPFGQKIAVLGKSGAGKSTFLQLIYGALSPERGSIKIGGYDPREYGEQIHEVLGILNQKPYLFATTVKNNLLLGNPDATEEELDQVISAVKLKDYIYSLPFGLETQMEETGQRFSGGERQRIALARILLKNTPIVILDEPTIGLDPITERDLLATVFSVLKDKTVIIITHHLIGLEKVDKIIFLDEGKISMQGQHHELLEKNNRYRQLYRLDSGEQAL